jgi:hypothetical protein
MDATDQLVLQCAAVSGNQKADETAQLPFPDLSGNINWQRFLADVARHGLGPLAHRLLSNDPEKTIPGYVKKQVHHGYIQDLARTILLNSELEGILECFHEIRLPAIILKGPYLSEKVYSQPNIRTYYDLDLFVKEEDVIQANLALKELGYEQCAGKDRFWWEKPYPELVFANTFVGSLCEIHWNLLDKKRFLSCSDSITQAIWKEANTIEFCGYPVHAMTPEHLLIHLCLHLSIVHRFGKLILFRDISELLNSCGADFDWSHFRQCISRWQINSSVYYPLQFAKRLLNAAVPDEILNQIRPDYLMGRSFEALFLKKNFVSPPQYAPPDALFLALRDKKLQRYKSTLGLPYRAFRWYLKGNTC